MALVLIKTKARETFQDVPSWLGSGSDAEQSI